jgi:hypothetical protein
MIPKNLFWRIQSKVVTTGLDIPVVEGLRSEDLPAPCIAIHTQSSENFNKSFTDVFRAVVSVRYDEHYADNSSQVVQQNFDLIVNAFMGDNLTRDLDGNGYKMFRASIDATNTEIINDFFSNEILLELIYERETN